MATQLGRCEVGHEQHVGADRIGRYPTAPEIVSPQPLRFVNRGISELNNGDVARSSQRHGAPQARRKRPRLSARLTHPIFTLPVIKHDAPAGSQSPPPPPARRRCALRTIHPSHPPISNTATIIPCTLKRRNLRRGLETGLLRCNCNRSTAKYGPSVRARRGTEIKPRGLARDIVIDPEFVVFLSQPLNRLQSHTRYANTNESKTLRFTEGNKPLVCDPRFTDFEITKPAEAS